MIAAPHFNSASTATLHKATFANVLALLGETRDDTGVHHLQHNLVIAGSVGEETGRLGARALKSWLQQRNIVLDDLSMCPHKSTSNPLNPTITEYVTFDKDEELSAS